MTRIRWIYLAAGLALTLGIGAVAGPWDRAAAQPDQDWPQIDVALAAGGLDDPVHITHAGDGSGRLFVVEQGGRIQIIENSAVVGTFLDITERVLSAGEQGLLSVAFPPGYGAEKDYFYVYYTNLEGNNRVSRFYLGANPDVADPDSEELILLFDHPGHANHNGGQLFFGPDSYLYIGTGDGGGGGDPEQNAQDTKSLLGKLLRIDVEFEGSGPIAGDYVRYFPMVLRKTNGTAPPPEGRLYSIPDDNPFVGQSGYRNEIWAVGLRNPWRFSFDRMTGDLYIGDVGQGTREEVDFQPAESGGGENYGWPIMEGDICYQAADCDDTGLTLPVAAYATHVGGTCAVTGGYVYRGQDFPALEGIYFFADYCNGVIWGLQQVDGGWEYQQLASSQLVISSFGEDEAGELYLVDRGSGSIYRLVEVTASR
jgi:glucose/arabinose dehydrogenase